MKKIFIALSIAVFFSVSGLAQGIYIRTGGAYGFATGTSSIGEKLTEVVIWNGSSQTSSASTKSVTGSFGSGISFNLAFGYKFNENLIFELGTQYLLGREYRTFDKYQYSSNDPYYPYSYVDNNTTSLSSRALLLNPVLVFSAGFGKAAPYGKFGVITGSPKVKGEKYGYNDGDGIDSVRQEWAYTKGFSLGFTAAIGMNWKLSEKLDFYTEINYVSLTYYPGEYNLTKSVWGDGFSVVDQLPNLSQIDKQTIYKKKFDPTTVNTDLTQSRVELRQAFPFSSISVQAGIRFTILKKKE
jgi:hypothetical protein